MFAWSTNRSYTVFSSCLPLFKQNINSYSCQKILLDLSDGHVHRQNGDSFPNAKSNKTNIMIQIAASYGRNKLMKVAFTWMATVLR